MCRRPRIRGRGLAGSTITRLAFVLGKPPRPSTIIADTIDALSARGCDIAIHLPHEAGWSLPPSVAGSDLVVQRGLRDDALVALQPVESGGVRCCNPIAATLAVADRLAVTEQLHAGGIAVPATRSVDGWVAVRAAASAGAVVVKSRRGDTGRGAAVAIVRDGELSPDPPFPGPWLLQELVPDDGWVRKLYVIGDHVRGQLKAAGTTARGDPTPLRPSASLAEIAIRAGGALRLDLFGVDIIVGPDGPQVVDVNAFPGYRGIGDAATLVASHLEELTP